MYELGTSTWPGQPASQGGNVTGDGRPNNEFAKWMASWRAQIQQRYVLIGHSRQKRTVENGEQKYPDDKPIEIADLKQRERPKAA